jgi:hypothetical protein
LTAAALISAIAIIAERHRFNVPARCDWINEFGSDALMRPKLDCGLHSELTSQRSSHFFNWFAG